MTTTTPHKCPLCQKGFKTKDGMLMHERDVHPKTYECPVCKKAFRTESGLDMHKDSTQHRNPVGRGGGRSRGRKGGSRTTNGRGGKSHDHKPPHPDIEGYWVRAKEFEGRKSFGRFQCPNCKKQWGSAHAFKQYKQGCQRCEMKSLPCCLWVNTGENDSDFERSDDEEDGPHDSARCEACRDGVCRLSSTYY